MPYATPKNHGKLTKLSVEPGDVRLNEPGTQQLRVVAHFEDGHDRDVTRLATYKVNDDSAIAVDPKGLARLLRRAEADLVVRYGSQVVSTRLATIINPDLKFDFAGRARHNFIDDLLFKRLESLKVPPSPPASDAVFLRRVSLDLAGEQPPTDRVREFLKDTDPEKRAKLVDEPDRRPRLHPVLADQVRRPARDHHRQGRPRADPGDQLPDLAGQAADRQRPLGRDGPRAFDLARRPQRPRLRRAGRLRPRRARPQGRGREDRPAVPRPPNPLRPVPRPPVRLLDPGRLFRPGRHLRQGPAHRRRDPAG